jgi:tRNA threonylcarbamoyladenosine biosynthesis protein TsaB
MAEPSPRLLLFETSGAVGRVGLAAGAALLSERVLDATRRHARDLVPAVADLLRDQEWQLYDLGGVAVSVGPGSYTGLRVGIMSAKTLAYALGCAVIAVPTFHLIAHQAKVPGNQLDVIADAQQGKLYVQRFCCPDAADTIVPTSELALVAGREWAGTRPAEMPVTGPGLHVAAPWLPTTTPIADSVDREPTVAALLAISLERWGRGPSDDALRMEPIYLRPSSAEEQWDRRGV